MEIFKLFGSIMVDSADAEKSISKTGDEAEKTGGKLTEGIKKAAKWAAGVTASAVAVGGAMVAAAKDTASNLDVIDKASQRMGVSAEQYQELAYAASLCGVEMSVLEDATKDLQQSGSELTFEDALAEIQSISDAGERSARAYELFGEKAYQMTPLLNAGTEGMAAMREEANELGLVIGQDAVSQGAAMNDMFSKVEGSIATLKTGLVSEFMPYVMQILEWLIENIPLIKQTIQNVLDAIMPIVRPVLDAVMGIIQSVFKLINGDFEGFKEGLIETLENLGTALLGLGEKIITALWDGMKNIWSKVAGWFDEKLNGIKQKFQDLKDKVAGFFSFGSDRDGSHAAGLAYVPYDGYTAELHRGETVLSAQNSQSLVSDIAGAIKDALKGAGGLSGKIEVPLYIDGKQFAFATYDAMQAEGNRRGVSLVGGR